MKMRVMSVMLPFLGGLLLCGCKAGEAKPAGFASSPERMSKDAQLPFHAVWYEKGYDWDAANKIIIRPVNTQYVEKKDWWNSGGQDRAAMKKDLGRLAGHFQSEIKRAFGTRKDNRFTVTESASPNTLILEVAIVDLVPTKAWLNAVGMVGLGASLDQGSIAIEGRVRDAQSNKVVGAFRDREQGKSSIVSIRDVTWYGHAEAIIKDWSTQFVQVLNSREDEYVKDSPGFTLSPL